MAKSAYTQTRMKRKLLEMMEGSDDPKIVMEMHDKLMELMDKSRGNRTPKPKGAKGSKPAETPVHPMDSGLLGE